MIVEICDVCKKREGKIRCDECDIVLCKYCNWNHHIYRRLSDDEFVRVIKLGILRTGFKHIEITWINDFGEKRLSLKSSCGNILDFIVEFLIDIDLYDCDKDFYEVDRGLFKEIFKMSGLSQQDYGDFFVFYEVAWKDDYK